MTHSSLNLDHWTLKEERNNATTLGAVPFIVCTLIVF